MNMLKDRARAVAIILIYLICLLTLLPVTSDAIIFGDDSRDDPVCFSEALQFYSRSVATFKIGWGRCGVAANCGTAFLISPTNLILTAAHNAPNLAPGGSIFGELVFDQQAETCDGVLAAPHVVGYSVPFQDIIINRDLDYMLFQPLDPATGAVIDVAITQGTHRWLKLNPDTQLTELEDDQKGLYVIGYNYIPDKLMIALDQECRIKEAKETCEQIEELGHNPPDDACLTHQCDIGDSQSGAPTIRYNQYSSNLGVISMVSGAEGGCDIWPCVLDNLDVKIRRIYQDIQTQTNGLLTGIYDDADGDGMPDLRDNCPDVPNTGTCTAGKIGSINCLGDEDCDTSPYSNDGRCEGFQLDSDGDDVGDACSTLDPDGFEPNDLPNQAAVLSAGGYPDLTIHDRNDTDFYLIAVPTQTDYFRIAATYTRRNRELAKWMTYKDCDTCPTALAPGEFKDVNSGWTYEERGDIPATRTYELELYEWEQRGPLSYELSISFGEEQLPPDTYESNDNPETATEFPGEGMCIFSGSLNIHNASDIDYYKIEAVGDSVKAEISFDTSLGDLQLFLCDASLSCTEATDSSTSDTTKTISITGCGDSPSYVQIQGQPNFYDFCLRTVPLEAGCPDYVPWTTFAGSGTFDYRIVSDWVPGQVDYFHGDVRNSLFVQLTDETDSEYIWTVQGWIDYPAGSGQLFRGTLTIPKGAPSGSTVPFNAHMPQMLQPGLRKWYQIEGECTAGNVDIFNCNTDSQCDSSFEAGDGVCTPVQAGWAQFQGPGSAITSFSAATVEDGLFWHISKAGDRGTLVVEGGLDTDGDGILDDVEAATGTDPNSDDTDGDGLSDGAEDSNRNGQVDYFAGETDPRLWDTDGDGISDGVEKGLTSPQANNTDPSTFQADLDPATTTDPTKRDTDGDGMSDGEEDANKNGRLDPGESSPLYNDGKGTPVGTNVRVNPHPDVTVTFTEVTGVGATSVEVSTDNPGAEPAGLQFLGIFYDIATTATYTGPVEVCITYDESHITAGTDEQDLQILHWNGTVWVDITSSRDIVNNIICGTVSDLSWFAVASFASNLGDGTLITDTGDILELPGWSGTGCGAEIGPTLQVDFDGDGINDTLVVVFSLTGQTYRTTFGSNGLLYMTATTCTSDGNARVKIRFVDMLDAEFNISDESTWVYKSIPALRIEGSNDGIPVDSPPVMNLYAYREINQTDRIDPLYGSLTGAGTKVFSDSAGIKEIYIRTGFAENNIDDFILMATPPNTLVGTDVTADLSNGSVTFDEVTIPGNTFIVESDTGHPLPTDMAGCSPWPAPPYFVVQTNADTSSTDMVCVNYSDRCNESQVALLAYRTICDISGCYSYWGDVTTSIDTASNTICSDGIGFGPFFVAHPLADADNDNYSNDVDCDDNDDTVYPGATEICDTKDNDCDGQINEGLSTDADGDGHYTPGSCDTPNDDCDDGNAGRYPGNPETCDGIDNDCDGQIDDGLSADADGDGHFTPGSCLIPADDCDDGNASRYPGNPEVCDGTDNDCDGQIDEELSIDADGDGHYRPGSCALPADDCDDVDGNNYPGNAEICDGRDNDCDGTADNGLSFITYYYDGDRDGFGNRENSLEACGPSGNHDTTDGSDCDDTTNTIGNCNTPPGNDPVTVTDETTGTEITFPDVQSGGDTTVEASSEGGDPPPDFKLGGFIQESYFNINCEADDGHRVSPLEGFSSVSPGMKGTSFLRNW
jgi:hypothetical protein